MDSGATRITALILVSAATDGALLKVAYPWPIGWKRLLDRWFDQEVKPRLQGRGELIRLADDPERASMSVECGTCGIIEQWPELL
jgi:hypothetical protein